MLVRNKFIQRLILCAGLLALSLTAFSMESDATITIDRVLNSPTLTVRYSGATAALAELILNGESYGTRVLNAQTNSGETNFTLTSSVLNDGENSVEIRLYDADGKLVGTQRTTIFAQKGQSPDVFLSNPKVGQTVQGPVELKVGFGHEMQNVYVSFFVDSQFKLMTNFPPYTYTWDTLRANNGWHEVEAWVVDESSATFKTKKVRVFVNNPGGNTARIFSKREPVSVVKSKPIDLAPSSNPGKTQDVAGDSDLRAVEPGGNIAAVITGHASTPLVESGEPICNPESAVTLGIASNLRLTPYETLLSTGFRHLVPTGTRMAPLAVTQPVSPPLAPNAEGDAALHSSDISLATGSIMYPSAEPGLHPVIAISVSNPAPASVSGDAGMKAGVARAPKPNATLNESAPVQPKVAPIPVVAPKSVEVVKATISPVKPVVVPVARPTVAKPAETKPSPIIKVSAPRPAIKVSRTVTTIVRIEPGVRVPHEGNYAVVMDGKLVEFDVQPRVESGVPMTPFRHLIERRGGKVDWTNETKSVTASTDGRIISLQIGTKIAQIDHSAVEMELAPYIEKGRTIVPLSFMRDSLHVNIDYDKATNHVLITSIKN